MAISQKKIQSSNMTTLGHFVSKKTAFVPFTLAFFFGEALLQKRRDLISIPHLGSIWQESLIWGGMPHS
jgi:hypothetical protein